ncbi:MAG: SH3 domain-containing protein [Rhizobacter sp.]
MPIVAAWLLLATLLSPPARAADTPLERLQVTDPYLELHTGPGRGYPVFFVVAREEWVAVELRYTDWFKVRTDAGKEGWVHRRQLETTLTEAGGKKTFRDVLVDDYLTRRVQLGASWGRFKSEPMLKLWTGYKLSDTLSVEGTLGQVQGTFSGSNFWHVDVLVEPWSDRRLSPFFGIGVGRFKNIPALTLVNATVTNANMAEAAVGARYYLTERFVVRVDYTIYTAFVGDTRSSEFRAITAGLSFFF